MRVERPALGKQRRKALVKSASILWGSFRDVTGPRSQSGELENRGQLRLVPCGDLVFFCRSSATLLVDDICC